MPAARLFRSSVVAPLDHRYVYAVVPPDTDKLATPVELPKQRTFVPEMLAASGLAGCVMVTVAVVEHPLASVTVTLYVPAARLDKSSLVDPFDQRYVYAVVPPDTDKLATPVELPKQRTFVPLILAASGFAGCVITTEAVVEQPLASVTVTLYVPAVRPVLSSVVTPPPQLNEYGAVPPDAVRLAAPVLLPKQRTLVPEMLAASGLAGCVITTEAVVEQPLASVTVTE